MKLALAHSLAAVRSRGAGGPAYDVLVHNTSELNAALAAHGVAGGVAIALDPAGTFSSGQTFTQNPAAPIRLISASAAQRAPLPSIVLDDCSKLTFERIDLGEDLTTGVCVSTGDGASATDITFDACAFWGADFDPYGDYSVNRPTFRRGFDTVGAGRMRGLFKVKNSVFHDLYSCIKPTALVDDNWFEGNDFDKFYDDGICGPWLGADAPTSIYVGFNTFRRACGLEADQNGTGEAGNGPHPDAFQMTTNDTSANGPRRIIYEGNRILGGGSRATMAAFLSRSTGAHVEEVKVVGNLVTVGDGFGDDAAPGLEDVRAAYVFGNRAAAVNPGASMSTSVRVYTQPGEAMSFIGGNIATAITTTGPKRLAAGDDANVALANTLGAAQGQFEGPTFNPATYAEMVEKYRIKAGAPLDHLREYVNYSAQTINRALEPAFLGFDNFLDQVEEAVCTTPWRCLIGGGDGQAITAEAGVEYRTADDAAGTNATAWTTAAGSIDEWKYVQARATAASTSSTTTTATLNVGGWPNSFTITTASAAVFPEVDNGGTARSTRAGTPSSSAGNTWLLMAFRFKHDAVGASNQAIHTHGTGGAALHFMMVGGTNYRVRLKSSGDLNASLALTPDTNWHTAIVAIDLTQTTAANVLKVYVDGAPVSTSGSPTIPTSGTVTFNQNDFNDLASWGETDNGAVFDGKKSFDYLHWGSGTIPFDITDAGARNKFTADLIDVGGPGYGPTSTQPKIYLNGNAAAWDAGIANPGSLGGTYAKSAGTYT